LEKSRRLVVVGRRGVVQNGFITGLSLDLSLDLAKVLLHLPQVVVRQHDGMPAVGLGHEAIMRNEMSKSRRRSWTAYGSRLAACCSMAGRAVKSKNLLFVMHVC